MSASAERDRAARRSVEEALGFGLASFRRLKGGSSPNYKAVRASDGFTFFAKLLDGVRARRTLPAIVSHAETLAGEKIARRLFADAPDRAGDFRLVCFEWCEGRHLMPDELSDDGLRAFLDDYLAFSDALQRTVCGEPPDPFLAWRREVMALPGRMAAPIRRLIDREVPESALVRRPELTKKVYGDFHHGNVLFREGRVYRYLDLESVGDGYPADDIVRYFACAFEHLPLGGIFRRRRMLDAFARAVRYLPYSRHEWMAAIDAALLRKFEGWSADELGPLKVANLLCRARFYLDLKSVASSSLQ